MVYALQYLFGCHFSLITIIPHYNGCPAQKMEGMWYRWTLAIQEYDFSVKHCKQGFPKRADVLSHLDPAPMDSPCAVTGTVHQFTDVAAA